MLLGRSDLPLNRDASSRILPWLVALMVYLAALALVSALVLHRAIGHWQEGLSGSLTIQVPAGSQGNTGPDKRLDKIVDILIKTPGVRRAEVLEPAEIDRLLEPWLGAGAAAPDLPVPTLISVTLDPAVKLDLDGLSRRLAQAVPDAIVDTHESWLDTVRDLARSLQLVAAVIVFLVGGCAIAIVIFATRMGLSVHGHVIQLLHLIGAQDSYVAAQFQSHALAFALRGGVIGLVLAAITVILVGRTLAGADLVLLPEFALQPIDWSILALLPVVIALIAMLTARLTVLRTLGRMP